MDLVYVAQPRLRSPNARMETGEQQWQHLDRGQADSAHLNDDADEGNESGSYEDGSYTGEEGDSEEESGSEDEEDEPVLKYRRFAKEVVDSLSQGNSQDAQAKNVIVCMAIHTKVSRKCPRS